MENNHTAEDQALDCLLSQSAAPLPPPGLADDILAAIRRQEAESAYRRAWYKRATTWACGSAAAICVGLAAWQLLVTEPQTSGHIAIDDTMVVDEVLDSIPDDDLFLAICAVSDADFPLAEY